MENDERIILREGKVALEGDNFASEEENAEWIELRAAWSRLGDDKWQEAARQQELINFRNSNRFCSVCGATMQYATEISLKCTDCGREIWPSLSPAIVVLITKNDGHEALLVHAANFRRKDMYALVAGFVETGETLEQCVAREIKEETTLEVSDIEYAGSQSWPFPSQLMIGFTAKYVSGELCAADGELTSLGWFTRDNLPELPTLPSLSRRIIDRWIGASL